MLNSSDWSQTREWKNRLQPVKPHALSKVRQLYLSLYEAITRGDLAHEQKLPSSRQLADQLKLGRNTVIAVYTQLHDEGLIVSSGRRGTRVHFPDAIRTVPDSDIRRTARSARSAELSSRSAATLSSIGSGSDRSGSKASRSGNRRLRGTRASTTTRLTPLTPGEPDASLFPNEAWRKALQLAARLSSDDLGYRSAPLPQLQQSLSRYLAIYRSLRVDPEQIIITSGTRQSLALAASMYADIGDHAWVESPGYAGAADAFRMMGLKLSACQVDGSGSRTDIADCADSPALIYLTPCFQYPTGAPLSAARRDAWLSIAQQSGAMIFEDDYDSEFRDDSQARPALASQQSPGLERVLHAGTFSKLIFPAARIAWLVVPTGHISQAHHCLRTLGGGHNSVAQAAVAEVIDNGSLSSHLQRARRVYRHRRLALIAELESTELFQSLTDTGGSLSLVARLKQAVGKKSLEEALLSRQLGALSLTNLQWDKPRTQLTTALVLGLGNVRTIDISKTVDSLAKAINAAY